MLNIYIVHMFIYAKTTYGWDNIADVADSEREPIATSF